MGDVAKDPTKTAYLNIRFPAGLLVEIDKVIRETQYVRDADGMRSEWVRDAATTRLLAEKGRLAGRYRALIERYELLMERHRPTFTRGEWETIVHMTREAGYFGQEQHARAVFLSRFEGHPLEERLRALPLAELFSVLDIVESYYAAAARGETPPALPGAAEPEKPRKR